jgi:hypothetical protein
LEGRNLIVKNELRFVKHSADQRALAIINGTAGNKPEQIKLRLPLQIASHIVFREIGIRRHSEQYLTIFFARRTSPWH